MRTERERKKNGARVPNMPYQALAFNISIVPLCKLNNKTNSNTLTRASRVCVCVCSGRTRIFRKYVLVYEQTNAKQSSTGSIKLWKLVSTKRPMAIQCFDKTKFRNDRERNDIPIEALFDCLGKCAHLQRTNPFCLFLASRVPQICILFYIIIIRLSLRRMKAHNGHILLHFIVDIQLIFVHSDGAVCLCADTLHTICYTSTIGNLWNRRICNQLNKLPMLELIDVGESRSGDSDRQKSIQFDWQP